MIPRCWFSVVTVTCYITPPMMYAASKRVAAASQELSKCFGDWMAGAELLPALMISRWVNLPLTTLRTVPRQLEHHHLDVSAHQPAHSSNPKTFLLKIPRCSGTEQQTIPVRSPLRVLYPPRVTHLPQSHWAPFQFARSAPGDLLLG